MKLEKKDKEKFKWLIIGAVIMAIFGAVSAIISSVMTNELTKEKTAEIAVNSIEFNEENNTLLIGIQNNAKDRYAYNIRLIGFVDSKKVLVEYTPVIPSLMPSEQKTMQVEMILREFNETNFSLEEGYNRTKIAFYIDCDNCREPVTYYRYGLGFRVLDYETDENGERKLASSTLYGYTWYYQTDL
jgi:hypothetical protein